ncbi:porin, partial [Paraburkholderia sp. SIMBA_030]
LIDEGLNFTSNAGGHSAWAMSSGDTAGSRWGLKGSEDLGGGYKAIFKLENGFNINTGKLGQDSSMFGRQAYVGLSSDHYGTITLGRQYDTSVDDYGFASLTAAGNWAGDISAHPFDNDNADWDYRVNNAVKYVSPTWRGLTGEAMYG